MHGIRPRNLAASLLAAAVLSPVMASAQSTKLPFIQILPLPKLIGKLAHLLSHQILTDSVVSGLAMAQHNLCGAITGFLRRRGNDWL